jgi:hypothetical protein
MTPTECLHGLWETNPYTKQPPTIFPQPLVMASTFDRLLVKRVFDAVSTEMRAKNNFEVKSKGVSRWGKGAHQGRPGCLCLCA